MTAKERKQRFNRLSELGCCICLKPAEIHHLIGYRYRGMGQKAEDQYTIPLCAEHHRGQMGIHRLGRKEWERVFGEQEYHLKKVNNNLDKYE